MPANLTANYDSPVLADDRSANGASVTDELGSLKTDIARLTTDVRNLGNALVEKGREVATMSYDETSKKLGSGVETCSQAIEQRPLTSVAIALGAGVVIGTFLLRSRA